jgi:DNA-binding MarR family transcriptional regulator
MAVDEGVEKDGLKSIVEIDRVMHEPARLLIMACLSAVQSSDFVFLMNQTELTKGNLSAHLRKLEAAGYVLITKGFVAKIPRTLIRMTNKGRGALKLYSREMRGVLEKLD